MLVHAILASSIVLSLSVCEHTIACAHVDARTVRGSKMPVVSPRAASCLI